MSELTRGGVETKDLKIENIELRDDIQNFADEKPIQEAVQAIVDEHITNQEQLLIIYHDELATYDYMFRCGRNEEERSKNTAMATPEDARSNVGASMFFRQVMTSSAKTYSLQHGRDVFFKYNPISTEGVPYSNEDGKMQADQLNTLARWNLDQINFDSKILVPIDMMIPRDGLALLAINWDRRKEMRKFSLPGTIDEATGKLGKQTSIELELYTKNQADFSIISPFSARLDPYINSIQDQECFSITDTIGMNDVVNLVKNGYWSENSFKLLQIDHRWDGVSGNQSKENIDANAGLDSASSSNNGKFLMWRVWINLPIDDDGKMDEKTVIPRRYICDFVGNKIDSSICMRIERNDDPDDEIPVEVIYDYPDSPDRFFHISKGHVLKNNYAIETTCVNQMLDNVSLVQHPPMIEKKSAIVTRPANFGRGARYVVRNNVNDDIREFNIADRTQTSLSILDYIKKDSQMAIHTDPAQMGEGLGSRTSATEASGVMKLSAAPSVMNAKYITEQLFKFVGRKLASYWKAFSLPEQVVQISDVNSPIQSIKPSEIYIECDVRVDVVDEVVEDIVEENKLSQDLAMFSKDPNLGTKVDMQALLEEYFIRRYKKSYVAVDTDYDAKVFATTENDLMMGSGKPANVEPTQNHRVHLDVHRALRLQYRGLEGEEGFKQIELLDRHIEQHMAALNNGGQSQPQQPQQEAPPSPTDGQPLGGAGDIQAQGVGGGMAPNVGNAMQKAAGQ